MQRSQGFEYGVQHFLSPKAGRLSEIIATECNISLEQTLHLLSFGAVYTNSNRNTGDTEIAHKDYVRVHTKPRRFEVHEDLRNKVLFENQDFLVVHKPSGLPCHASVDNLKENLHFALQTQLKTKLFVTTRLDVPTEGVLVYAKTESFLRQYNLLAQEKKIRKIYSAAVENSSSVATMELTLPHTFTHYLEQSPKAPKKMKTNQTLANDQICELILRGKKNSAKECQLEIQLITGRTHQIRAQLSLLGSPIIGDELYGSAISFEKEKIKLTAVSLQFPSFQESEDSKNESRNDQASTHFEFFTTPTW